MDTNEKISNSHIHKQVFERMKEAIKDGSWKENEKIPSETELADRYGVSRLSVRIAIQRLAALGLVETRQGDGTYVREFSFQKLMEEVSGFYMSPKLLDDVYEFRKTFEVRCALLAMDNGTDEEYERLYDLCSKHNKLRSKLSAEEYNENTFFEFLDYDMAFHTQICQMSHNELFTYIYEVAREPVFQYLHQVIQKRLTERDSTGADIFGGKNWQLIIYNSLRNKNVREFLDAFFEMIDCNYETMQGKPPRRETMIVL